MREIKFRGKRINNGEWVCGMPVFDTGGQCYIITEMMSQITCCSDCGMPDVIYYEVDPDTVGQFTGLKDKNGVEIYEWDIIRHHDDILSEVFYNTAHCAYLLRDINGHRNKCVIDRLGAYSSLWIEVIGNIYDNPELIGGAE